ncbi:divisome protein SepX/GlpR [Geodermatophilus amargosae]|uniref:divisome protein SepX/GlpR n=1 Tax=Geodermatophilus amargosae TaxID=1296565 RepID=UPI0034DE3DC4
MGSGVLLAALVVLWFVVLVPMVVTRGDSSATRAEVTPGRTLQRRRGGDPVRSAETERVSVDREFLRRTGELRIDVHAVRRRTLAGLGALTLLALVGALTLTPWLWVVQGLLDAALVGYLVVLRAVVRRERAAARRAARAARPAPRPAPRVAEPLVARSIISGPVVAEEPVHPTVGLPHPSLPLAPVHPLRPARVVAARPVPVGWQDSAVVGLDDDDIGFADIDLYQPRVVNG